MLSINIVSIFMSALIKDLTRAGLIGILIIGCLSNGWSRSHKISLKINTTNNYCTEIWEVTLMKIENVQVGNCLAHAVKKWMCSNDIVMLQGTLHLVCYCLMDKTKFLRALKLDWTKVRVRTIYNLLDWYKLKKK